jgi:hypothetical protein
MKSDRVSGKEDVGGQLGKALPGRHLLDGPSHGGDTAYQVRDWHNAAPVPRSFPLRPRTPPPLRTGNRPCAPATAPEPVSRAVPTVAEEVEPIGGETDDNDHDDSAGLVSRNGCPRGWLISEAELERRFARLNGRFEDIEEDTEANRPAPPAKAEGQGQGRGASASYTSLFDLTPRRRR